MPKIGSAVLYNDGQDNTLALVAANPGDKKLDLIVFASSDGQSSKLTGVPRRDPKDYGSEGGGRTWHPVG